MQCGILYLFLAHNSCWISTYGTMLMFMNLEVISGCLMYLSIIKIELATYLNQLAKPNTEQKSGNQHSLQEVRKHETQLGI